jgi:hypothetical protein
MEFVFPREKTLTQEGKAMAVGELVLEEQLLQQLGIQKTTLGRLRRTKGFPTLKVGRARFYSMAAVTRWTETHQRVVNPNPSINLKRRKNNKNKKKGKPTVQK